MSDNGDTGVAHGGGGDGSQEIMTQPVTVAVPSTNGSSAKAFGGIAAVVALILGVYAMSEPMGLPAFYALEFFSTDLESYVLHSNEEPEESGSAPGSA